MDLTDENQRQNYLALQAFQQNYETNQITTTHMVTYNNVSNKYQQQIDCPEDSQIDLQFEYQGRPDFEYQGQPQLEYSHRSDRDYQRRLEDDYSHRYDYQRRPKDDYPHRSEYQRRSEDDLNYQRRQEDDYSRRREKEYPRQSNTEYQHHDMRDDNEASRISRKRKHEDHQYDKYTKTHFYDTLYEMKKEMVIYEQIIVDNIEIFKPFTRYDKDITYLFNDIDKDVKNLLNRKYNLCNKDVKCYRIECCAYLHTSDMKLIINAYEYVKTDMASFETDKLVWRASRVFKRLEELRMHIWYVYSRKKTGAEKKMNR